jgi:hypothetical protein
LEKSTPNFFILELYVSRHILANMWNPK